MPVGEEQSTLDGYVTSEIFKQPDFQNTEVENLLLGDNLKLLLLRSQEAWLVNNDYYFIIRRINVLKLEARWMFTKNHASFSYNSVPFYLSYITYHFYNTSAEQLNCYFPMAQ